jgi:hypothetical protein
MKEEYIYFPPRETARLKKMNEKKGDEYFKRVIKESISTSDAPVPNQPVKRKSMGTRNYD